MLGNAAEKIDFLMRLTSTQNAVLAHALSFDASYISRIRNGRRGLPLKAPFIEPAAAFFTKRIASDYQKRAVEYELGRPWPADEAQAEVLLAAWLAQKADAAEGGSGAGDAFASATDLASAAAGAALPDGSGTLAHARLFYGNAGRRNGVLAFLRALDALDGPATLLLHSDEEMVWLVEDADFIRQWNELLMSLIGKGGRIRIIHSVSRDADELWEAMRKWIPLYMTGAIEPFYYPRLRDGVYRRTLFVAPGHVAMMASSVRDTHGDPLCVLLDDAVAIAALEGEFNDYLALCRPLLREEPLGSPAELSARLTAFAHAHAHDSLTAAVTESALVCSSEEQYALIASLKAPYILFGIDEARMVGAVWEFLRNMPDGSACAGDEAQRMILGLAEQLV